MGASGASSRGPHETPGTGDDVRVPRWNTWTHVRYVQFDDELLSKPRAVRQSGPALRVGDPVRIGMGGGVELDAVIVAIDGPLLRVKAAEPERRG